MSMVGNDWVANGRIRNHFVWKIFKALGYLPVISTLGLMGGVEAVVMLRWMVDHHSLGVSTKTGTELWVSGTSHCSSSFLPLLFDPVVSSSFAVL